MSEDSQPDQQNTQGIEIKLNAKQAAIISLVAGLIIGGLAGFSAGAAMDTGATVDAPSDQNNGDTQPADMTAEETFREISSDLDLDTEGLMQCYDSSNNEEANEDRENIASEVGNIGTPTFFIGNKEKGFVQVTGAQPLSQFDEAISTMKSDNPNSSGELVKLESVELEGEPSKGDGNAEIKVIEYTDFGCPFCAEWQGVDASSRTPIDERNIGPEFEKKYVDTGEVEFIMKDLPVPQLHPNGPKAHQFANCVYENEQDSYWDVHDELFERRDSWMKG